MSSSASIEEEVAAGMFGMLDILVLGGVAVAGIYWFFLRKSKEDSEFPDVKKMTAAPSMAHCTADSGFITKMKSHGRNVVVFYGSQTGTAEDFAGRLAKDAARYGLKGMVADPEECDMDDIPQLTEIENSLVIFCVATYGEGDPTDNAHELNDWLQDTDCDLDGVKYAVFSLGNKTYEHYNKMGKYVDKRLSELGAERVSELGLGDDDANIEEDFMSWREQFWPDVCDHFGIESTGEDINMRQYAVTFHDEEKPSRIYTGEIARYNAYNLQKPPYDVKNPFLAPVVVNRELHNGGDRSCLHMEFDITGSKIRYDSGDHIAVYPTNNSALVEGLGKCLGIDLGQTFTLTNVDDDASKRHPFPCPTSWRTAFTHYLDISAPPRMSLLKELADYAEKDEDKQFLLKMGSNTEEGHELYHRWIQHDCRHIVAVLEDLPSVKPSADHLCELLPRLQPRFYSISSSPKVHPTTIHVTAIVVEWETPTNRRQLGVATTWLKTKQPIGEERPQVPVYVRKSQFRLPFKPTVPVIMIGPGTGIAPFRGFLQDRDCVRKDGKPIGDTILYSGCRNRAVDYIYGEELDTYQADGTLTHLHMAFSRDQPHKVYVQHLLKENGEETWKVLENGGHLYVCGDARNMAHDVDKVLESIIVEHGGLTEQKATDYLRRLRSRGRYSCDVWS